MSNLIDIQSQIEKLQKQATDIKAREFNKTVQDILAKMQAFGITAKDLQAAKVRVGKGKSVRTRAAKKSDKKGAGRPVRVGVVAAKYRGPAGETWSGRGLMPRWLSALVAQGRSREEFAIKA